MSISQTLKSCSDSRSNCCVCVDAAPTQSLALSSMLLLLLLLHGHTQAVPVGTTTNNVNQCHKNFYISRGLSGFYTRCTCSWTSFSKRWTLCSCRSTSVSWAEMCEDRPERRSDCLFKRTWNTNKQRWIREPEIGHTIWLFFFFLFYPLSDTFHINSSVSYDFSCSPEFCPLDKTHLCATVFIQIQKEQVFTHVFNQFKCWLYL